MQGHLLKFKNYLDIFRIDEIDKKIESVPIQLNIPYVIKYSFYRYWDNSYPHKQVLIYYENRLLSAFIQPKLCGFMILSHELSIDICKTRLEKHQDELALIKLLHKIHKFMEEKERQKFLNEME